MEGRFIPRILSAVFITLSRPFLSAFLVFLENDSCDQGALYQSSVGLGEEATVQIIFPERLDEMAFSTVNQLL